MIADLLAVARCANNEGMSARHLMVGLGDRVSLAGVHPRVDDQDRLELARALGIRPRRGWKSVKAIRAIGLDPDLIPKDFGPRNNLIRSYARVTGIWHRDAIIVDG